MMEAALHKTLPAGGGGEAFRLAVEFTLGAEETLGLYGPSGAGKTTLLRLLAGLIRPDGGYLRFAGETWADAAGKIHLPPAKRSVGFVFQDYALFPNMTARENLAYSRGDRNGAIEIDELIDVFGLSTSADRRPGQLSGGQQQRVALARAIAQRPRLLLLDEPLAALDERLREELQRYLLTIRRRFAIPTVLCSHHAEELRRLCDRVMVLEGGRVMHVGTPADYFPDKSTPDAVVEAVVERVTNPNIYLRVGQDQIVVPNNGRHPNLHSGGRIRITLTDEGVRLL